VVNRAIQWERRSRATFESMKTTLMHFTRIAARSSIAPISIKDKIVLPKREAKILGVIIDLEPQYRKHIANAATKGLNAALAFKRLRMLLLQIAR
jgi:hypothetical protein